MLHSQRGDQTRPTDYRQFSAVTPAYLTEQIISCMDTSGCPAPFTDSELSRLLSEKSLHLYHRLKQAKEVEEAAIDGLESCPACSYAAVIENPDEKLFRCEKKGCRQVSCRKCRKLVRDVLIVLRALNNDRNTYPKLVKVSPCARYNLWQSC